MESSQIYNDRFQDFYTDVSFLHPKLMLVMAVNEFDFSNRLMRPTGSSGLDGGGISPGSRFRMLYKDLLISRSSGLLLQCPLEKGSKNGLFVVSSWSSRLFNKSIVASSWHSSLMNSSDLKHLKQHQSSQKYFLNRKATRVRHMATQNMSGPCNRLNTIPMYFRDVICKSDMV